MRDTVELSGVGHGVGVGSGPLPHASANAIKAPAANVASVPVFMSTPMLLV